MLFVCYPKCTTCQKAQKWLEEKGVEYQFRDIKQENPTEQELRQWHAMSGLPLKRLPVFCRAKDRISIADLCSPQKEKLRRSVPWKTVRRTRMSTSTPRAVR